MDNKIKAIIGGTAIIVLVLMFFVLLNAIGSIDYAREFNQTQAGQELVNENLRTIMNNQETERQNVMAINDNVKLWCNRTIEPKIVKVPDTVCETKFLDFSTRIGNIIAECNENNSDYEDLDERLDDCIDERNHLRDNLTSCINNVTLT